MNPADPETGSCSSALWPAGPRPLTSIGPHCFPKRRVRPREASDLLHFTQLSLMRTTDRLLLTSPHLIFKVTWEVPLISSRKREDCWWQNKSLNPVLEAVW